MLDFTVGQEAPGGNVIHYDAYFTPQDVLCVQIIALGTLL